MNTTPNRQATRGFSLIEVLVTILVLAIGLLGLAGLQSTGLRFNHSAYLRSQASVMANDIFDRMRTNRDAAEAGNYDIDFGITPTATACTGAGATCTESAMAQADLSEWKALLTSSLPQGDGQVLRTAYGSSYIIQVSVQWNDDRSDPTSLQTFTISGEL